MQGAPGPVKAKVYSTQDKQMDLAFFNIEGLIFTYTVSIDSMWIPTALERQWLWSWGGSGWKGQNWFNTKGFSTLTRLPSAPPPSSTIYCPPAISRFSCTHPNLLIRRLRNISYSPSKKKSWQVTHSHPRHSKSTGWGCWECRRRWLRRCLHKVDREVW